MLVADWQLSGAFVAGADVILVPGDQPTVLDAIAERLTPASARARIEQLDP